MNKFFASALVAGTMVAATPAFAVDYSITLAPVSGSPGAFRGSETVSVDTPTFSDVFSFNTPTAGNIAASAITLTIDGAIELTSVYLNTFKLDIFKNGNQYSAVLPNGTSSIPTGIDPQKVFVNGNFTASSAPGGQSGDYTVLVRFNSAVPEPATWALMILGFGVVGYSLRRRPSVRFAQAI